MIDYLLRFTSKTAAEQFGIASGFASEVDGEVVSNIASHEHALHVVGDYNSAWWVLFRDLVGIPIPDGADQYIYWASDFTVEDEDGNPVPVPRPISDDVPNIWWA
jgi:hypothetical protein